jgi:hypothetical protein
MSDYKTSDNILAFIKSVKETHSKDEIDLVVLYKNIPLSVIDETKKAFPGIKLEDYSSYYERYGIDKNLSPYHVKFIIIYYFIKNILNIKYDHILISDINDVFIQDNIFSKPGLNDINFFAETLSIKESKINLKKYRSCYSPQIVNRDKDKKVICNGVILIRHKAILNFLEIYTKELQNSFSATRTPIVCQVTFIYCAYNIFKTWKNVTIHSYPNELCLHLAQPSGLGILTKSISYTDKKINYQGLTPCIIHQYNRSETLTKFIFNQYGLTYKKTKISTLIKNRIKGIFSRLKNEISYYIKKFGLIKTGQA